MSTPETGPLRRAAALLREVARQAPDGPYELGWRDTESPQYRLLFAGDGDPMGAVRYWSGGIGRDIGEEEQTGRFVSLWTPRLALELADWLDAVAHRLTTTAHPGWWEVLEPQAYALARTVLGESSDDPKPEASEEPSTQGEVRIQSTRYTVSCLPEEHEAARHLTVFVEYRGQDRWAVVWPGTGCLSSTGEWHYESLPSERAEEWLAEHRFPLAEAMLLARKVAPTLTVNGLTVEQVRARQAP